ncbi:MAG TPA: AraC family transcriptional regulator [Blastocatellia bacterium]|nr:AraC family transcriptional regulator [Blastocatellia bacterium]
MNTQPAAVQLHHNGFRVSLLTDPPGRSEVPGQEETRVSIHAGPPVQISCRRAGHYYSGTSLHGDIHIIPAGTPSVWEIKGRDTFLTLGIARPLLRRAAEELGLDPDKIEIINRFQARDRQLENIGWALKEELESGNPCGPIYLDSLALTVAMRLICCHSSQHVELRRPRKRLSDGKLRQLLDYVEDNLAENLSLDELAAVVGLSVSHFKVLFREATGLSPHQYVIRRRIERARNMLSAGELSIAQIASLTGFAHQSHLARHMHRLLGVSPRALREMAR